MPGFLGPAEIGRRLTLPMDAAGAATGVDRARVIVVRDDRLAVVERVRQGRRYWVLPGGGVEEGETLASAALREAGEELGVCVTIGALRVLVHTPLADGGWHRHWCFDASADSDAIAVVGGPEVDAAPEDGTYRAVWLRLDELGSREIWPSPPIRMLAAHHGSWPDTTAEVCES